MKTSEDLLKELILSKYKSIREFTTAIQMPYTTVDSLLKRGIKKASVDNVMKICSFLKISADALVDGRIETSEESFHDVDTLAAHFDAQNFTEDELDEIMNFVEFVKNKRKSEKERFTKYSELLPNAAHERTDIDVTDEMRKYDDDIMDDENF